MTSLIASSAMIGASATPATATPDTDHRCTALSDAHISATTITRTVLVPATGSIPEHCLVDGYVTTPGDASVPNNRVNVQVGLPTDWNHDLHFQGVGGFAGVIGPLDTGLRRGYASASTDTGHRGSDRLGTPTLDGSWALGNRPAQTDYAYRGTHVATVAAQAVTTAYYRRAPRYSVFNGCSNGGRQGLVEAQRFPGDYDAVIADAPAIDVVGMLATWIRQMKAQLAANGDAWLPPGRLPALAAASLKRNDGKDGLVDGLIGDPRNARFDPGVLRSDRDPGDRLTNRQVETVRAIYRGLRSEPGRHLIPGQPIGHEDGWTRFITGTIPPETLPNGGTAFPSDPAAPFAYNAALEFLRYIVFSDPNYALQEFDMKTDLPALDKAIRRDYNADDPDLTAFAAHGGKLLITHGWADPALNPRTLIRYYGNVIDKTKPGTVSDFLRLFMVPGMFHCGGGPGTTAFDALPAMEKWLRRGIAPAQILATNPATGRTRPLCPYPQVARHQGGSIEKAENFRCEPPRPHEKRPASN
ncbi:tannase/feruloyl esterase family alpha/beta hydrolase [Actinomadura sp. 3N407]|uniref:tannase/feruloyl esterase family alpha/beta hydrolase n=1 Tax=Actinomadura sp. 3N407 TaxID=3457423 RepID=UPI003FCD35E2